MPVRQRKPNGPAQQLTPLLLLGIGLVTTNRSIAIIDDEARTVGWATRSVWEILSTFLSSRATSAVYARPPLFDILLHFWLKATGGLLDYLRLPSILFFLAGVFLLGRASRYFVEKTGGISVIWLGVLWPFGYLLGREAAWYPLAFFLVAGVTLAYLKLVQERTQGDWTIFLVFAIAMLWTSYLGWAVLACLGFDLFLRARKGGSLPSIRAVGGTVALLVAASVPFILAFRHAIQDYVHVPSRPLAALANLGFSGYSLFVSESIAPWYWAYSIPAGIAILVCIGLVIWRTPAPARRFLFYLGFLIALMAVLGILNTKRLLMISPWLLLPIGVVVETSKPRWSSVALALSLFAIAGIGWYGIYARQYYSAPQFIEPWSPVASDAAAKVINGATVISDHPSFLLYLTYDLQVPHETGPWKFAGLAGYQVQDPHIFLPAAWIDAGHPTSPQIIVVRGGAGDEATDAVAHQLDQACGSISSRLMLRDQGYEWKQRFVPQLREPLWRIEVREYDCGTTPSH